MKTFPHSKDTISSHIQRTSSYQTISIRLSYRKIPTSGLPIEISHKYLNILLLSNITTLEQITLPDKTTIMQDRFSKIPQKAHFHHQKNTQNRSRNVLLHQLHQHMQIPMQHTPIH
jgi:hypothetical protein